MLKNPNLTNYSISLIIFFNGFILLGISLFSISYKNSTFQKLLFYLAGLSLSFTIYTTGSFFANYSGLHDICDSIVKINERPIIPERGIGLINFIGCQKENSFF